METDLDSRCGLPACGAPRRVVSVPDDEASSKAASWADGERTIYFAMDLPTGEGATDIYFSTCE
jgi:hypothetical protein